MSDSRRLGRVEIVRLLDDAAVHPSKALGQNFVVDPNLTDRIARLAAVGAGDEVLEIGAGLGSLTVALASTGARVTAVEVDHRLVGILEDLLPSTVRLVQADALELDVASLYPAETHPASSVVLVANLPYNVATPLVLRLLEEAPVLARLLVMVQREVAERFAAPKGSKTYGAVSARIAYFATAQIVGMVPPEVFHPRPNVTSALVELTRRTAPAVPVGAASYAEIVQLIRAGFAGRRKMLRRSLAGMVADEVFERAGVAPTARAEELDIGEWGKLAACRRSTSSSPTQS